MALEHFAQAPERRGRALLLDQKGRKNRARRIVHRHDQIQRRLAHQPLVTRTVLMQHHAGQRTARPSAPMRAAPLGLLQQALRLQKRLRPAVAPPEIVALRQLLVKVLGREAGVALAIQSFHFLLPIHRNPPARRLAQPAVQQAGFAVVLEADAPASKRPLPDPEQLRRFQLSELRSLVATQNIPELDHTNPLEGFRPAHPTSPKGQTLSEKRYRTDRVLPKPAISSASDKRRGLRKPETLNFAIIQNSVIEPIPADSHYPGFGSCGDSESFDRSAPAQIARKVLDGDAVEAPDPFFDSAMVGVHVVDVMCGCLGFGFPGADSTWSLSLGGSRERGNGRSSIAAKVRGRGDRAAQGGHNAGAPGAAARRRPGSHPCAHGRR